VLRLAEELRGAAEKPGPSRLEFPRSLHATAKPLAGGKKEVSLGRSGRAESSH